MISVERSMEDRSNRYLLTLFLQSSSLMELESLEELHSSPFRIVSADRSIAIIESTDKAAAELVSRVGGCFKVAKVLEGDLRSSLEQLNLPFEEKFSWTVSGYQSSPELLLEARQELHAYIKSRGLGKSKFIQPEVSANRSKEGISSTEIRSVEVSSKILRPKDGHPGMDFVVYEMAGKPVYAQTIETSDFDGFNERDFSRPHQDPRRTLSPRIARMLVNLAATKETHSLLDPFCGVGTILQEAIACNYSVVGTDKNQIYVERCEKNLKWTRARYGRPNQSVKVFAYDAKRLSRARMPQFEAIVSEPILLPVYDKNPSRENSKDSINQVLETYERCFREFAPFLSSRKGRIAITSPILSDSSGHRSFFSLEEVAAALGLKPYRGRLSGRNVRYPLEMGTGKKRIVQRALNVYEAS